MKVGFVWTNYNNAGFTRAAVSSLDAGGRADDVRIVVVDNHSEDTDITALEEIGEEFPNVTVVLNPDNVGYFRGLNIGLRVLRSSHPEIEHVVIGNDDLEYPRDFVATVERCQSVFLTWAVVAPDVVTKAGVHQNPHVVMPISGARKLIWDLHYLSYATAVLVRFGAGFTRRFTTRRENMNDRELYETPGAIEQGYGACYMLGPLFFQHFSGLCAPTFFNQEEFFLSEQLKAIGQEVYYDPQFVVHHSHNSTMKTFPRRRSWSIGQEAHRIYKRYLRMAPSERVQFLEAWGGGRTEAAG